MIYKSIVTDILKFTNNNIYWTAMVPVKEVFPKLSYLQTDSSFAVEWSKLERSLKRPSMAIFNLLSIHDVISRHAVATMQWPGCLKTSCFNSGLTQNL